MPAHKDLSVEITSGVDQPYDLGYIPQLDGLRALAVSFVLFSHGLDPGPSNRGLSMLAEFGGVGVQVFFVLSGFLISGILLKAKGKNHYFRNFYARRGLRIWPLYFLILIVAFTVYEAGPSPKVPYSKVSVWVYLAYLQNIFYGHDRVPVGLGPTWSLAVEEQFYIVWPLVIWRSSKRTLQWICVALILISPLIRMMQIVDTWNILCQLDSLALGALLACYRNRIQRWNGVARCALLLFPLGIYLQLSAPEWLIASGISKLAFVYASAALLVVALDSRSWLCHALMNPLLRYVGRISYGVYLYNVFVFVALGVFFKGIRISETILPHIAFLLVGSVITIGVAGLSYLLFEGPILKLKSYFP